MVAEVVLHHRPLPAYVTDLIMVEAADANVHRPSADLGLVYELNPGAKSVFKIPHTPPRTVTVNSLGLRDPERSVKKAPGVFRIIILGSSTTYGAAVNDNETFPLYTEEILNEHAPAGRRYEVWNAGVSAYTPIQMAALGRRLIQMGCEPDAILFQIHLTGPRGFLWEQIDLRAFAADPSLFAEHFCVPDWLAGVAPTLASRSRLALLLIAYYNRVLGVRRRDFWLNLVRLKHHQQAIKDFVRDYGARIHLATINVPCLRPEDNREAAPVVAPAGLPIWCVDVNNNDRNVLLLHPPAYVNRLWAERLAELLETRDGFH